MKVKWIQYGWLDGAIMAVAVLVVTFVWQSDASRTATIVTVVTTAIVACVMAAVVQIRRERRSGPEGGRAR